MHAFYTQQETFLSSYIRFYLVNIFAFVSAVSQLNNGDNKEYSSITIRFSTYRMWVLGSNKMSHIEKEKASIRAIQFMIKLDHELHFDHLS